ncbi:asparagine synthase (glutamine-hydrolyzing) [Actinoplanes sp. NEAU-A12]|uniref:asparagine synthase (glutamine-hydrolyzing) n=1 Tax=Actinoplanes sandaracinus TaxID=3045177 RepID=A0ABT6WUB4_9ACTN|nr:asparagine synthase (glutamine-hydrolyzing) [Actinoplanes sandaracinus]MDI6103346.1 asparagine synthase (glutamine-hydrolyzing) [Actinoplanes sandaracinus]
MCGIAGVLGAGDQRAITEMIAALEHRGPDGAGRRIRSGVHLAAARLAIIDPAAGPQPVSGHGDTAAVVFNGEIYNHGPLRAELRSRGHVFVTGTDTEVVLHSYEEWGEDCPHHLSGMFAFAVDDGRRVFLARDRLGIKPLYYAILEGGRRFAFASEIKAFLRIPGYRPELDFQAFSDARLIGHPVGDRTYFSGIRKLPPGHTLIVGYDDGWLDTAQPRPYHRRVPAREPMPYPEAEALLEAALAAAVERHLAADVEVGLTLSGGLDSTLLALFAAEQRDTPLRTFTAADHADHPDVVQAGHVARLIGGTHHVTLPTFDEFLGAIPAYVAANEQPSSLHGLPFFLGCRQIAGHVKACLHGEGADELFGGYSVYLDRARHLRRIRARLATFDGLAARPGPRALETVRRLVTADGFDDYLTELLDLNLTDQLERNHLDPVDQCGMAAGLELRVPYLDDDLVALTGRLPVGFLVRADLGIRKYILRRLALRRFGDSVTDVVLREKLGVPSSGARFLARFAGLCDDLLPPSYLASHPLGAGFATKHALVIFEMFFETFFVHRGDPAGIGTVTDFLSGARAGRRSALAGYGLEEMPA